MRDDRRGIGRPVRRRRCRDADERDRRRNAAARAGRERGPRGGTGSPDPSGNAKTRSRPASANASRDRRPAPARPRSPRRSRAGGAGPRRGRRWSRGQAPAAELDPQTRARLSEASRPSTARATRERASGSSACKRRVEWCNIVSIMNACGCLHGRYRARGIMQVPTRILRRRSRPDLASDRRGGAGSGTRNSTSAGLEPLGPWLETTGGALYPASMIKLPLAVAAGVGVEAGRLRGTRRVDVDPANATVNDTPSPMSRATADRRRAGHVHAPALRQRRDQSALSTFSDRGRATRRVHALGFRATLFRRKLSGAQPLIDDPQATGRNASRRRKRAALSTARRRRAPAGGHAARDPRDVVVGRQALARARARRRVRPQDGRHGGGLARRRDPRRSPAADVVVIVVYRNCPAATRTTRASARSCARCGRRACRRAEHARERPRRERRTQRRLEPLVPLE